ncbi:FmdB family zinc ribbon protein [Piscinibacter koreensis]|uniref:Zinc ribbon domain-containing protein n=1 Tax=Piscinibacter koreensis TaxID=2742824 RepID=A0A7Y6NKB3_9BURK|nr:zinc ribbon domain-containing protein [Schlegelella koreensis]NUZ04661.1 zinc ribbon domain-containing protein [Schlegelella koreensis]
MPIYDYECRGCGPFMALRPMAQFRDLCACPECGADAARILVGAPAIARGGPHGRRAGAANEPGATDPRPQAPAHPAGCGCCVRRMPLPGALSGRGRIFTSSGPFRRGEP